MDLQELDRLSSWAWTITTHDESGLENCDAAWQWLGRIWPGWARGARIAPGWDVRFPIKQLLSELSASFSLRENWFIPNGFSTCLLNGLSLTLLRAQSNFKLFSFSPPNPLTLVQWNLRVRAGHGNGVWQPKLEPIFSASRNPMPLPNPKPGSQVQQNPTPISV